MVPDPSELRRRLLAAGARPGFTGMMRDCRYDQDGRLLERDEMLRVRVLRDLEGREECRLTWKGPVSVTSEGYKARRELEYLIAGTSESPGSLLERLGYSVSMQIDRYIEVYELAGAVVRLEWYPRMDVLVEIEGDSAGIEAALAVTGLPRSAWSADALVGFAGRYAARTGREPLLALDPGSREPPSWESR